MLEGESEFLELIGVWISFDGIRDHATSLAQAYEWTQFLKDRHVSGAGEISPVLYMNGWCDPNWGLSSPSRILIWGSICSVDSVWSCVTMEI
jgi:hypothetical protein